MEWLKDDASFLAAALAYFSVFSLVPLFIVVLILLNYLFNLNLLSGETVNQAQDLAIKQAPKVAGEIIDRAGNQAASASFTVLSLLTMLVGGAGLFVQTKKSFKVIWKLPDEKIPLREMILSYLSSFVLIASVALLLLATSLVTAFLLPVGRQIEDLLPIHLGLLRMLTFFISFVFVTVLFAITYKTLAGVELDWRDVIPGSALASLLFAVGNFIIETLCQHRQPRLGLWRCGLPGRPSLLDLLLGADLSLRRGVRQGAEEMETATYFQLQCTIVNEYGRIKKRDGQTGIGLNWRKDCACGSQTDP